MKFIDEYQLYHDRDVGENYKSGNSVLYSAFADNLGLYLGKFNKFVKALKTIQNLVYYNPEQIITYRYMDNKKPDSIDNIIGFVHFGFLNASKFKSNKWYFNGSYKQYEDISWYQAIKSAWKIRNEHRNYWWQNNMHEVGKIANLVAPQYRHYILKMSKEKTTWYYLFAFYLHILVMAFSDNVSAKNICDLMLTDLKSKILIKLFNRKKNYLAYFPKNHPFNNVD